MSRSWRQLRVLHREFLFRVVDRELLSTHAQGDMSKLLIQFAALLIFVSLMFVFMTQQLEKVPAPQLRIMLGWMNVHRLIAATMLVVGLFAVLSWQSMFPDRQDVHVLGPLPVRPRTLLFAKVAAVDHGAAGDRARAAARRGDRVAGGAESAGGGADDSGADLRSAAAAGRCRGLEGGDGSRSRGCVEERRAGAGRGRRHRDWRLHARRAARLRVWRGDAGVAVRSGIGDEDVHRPRCSRTWSTAGLTRLDEPVRELIPDAGVEHRPGGDGEITLLDLATHRSSLRTIGFFVQAGRSRRIRFADYTKERLYIYLRSRGLRKYAELRVHVQQPRLRAARTRAGDAGADGLRAAGEEGDYRCAQHARHRLHAERRAEAAIHAAVSRGQRTASSSEAVRRRRAGGRGRAADDRGRHADVGGGEPASGSTLGRRWRGTHRLGRGDRGRARAAREGRTERADWPRLVHRSRDGPPLSRRRDARHHRRSVVQSARGYGARRAVEHRARGVPSRRASSAITSARGSPGPRRSRWPT